jgi:hypothetical protein
MACSHAESCPLHPHLNDSLAGWREHYCDSSSEWKQCARFEKSLTGQPVPLALLPNGKTIGGAAGIAGGDKPRAKAPSQPVAQAAATAVGATATAVLTDEEAEGVLETARTTKPSFWNRFTNLFGGFK